MRGNYNIPELMGQRAVLQQPCPLSTAAQEVLMQKYASTKLFREPRLSYVGKYKQTLRNSTKSLQKIPSVKTKSFFAAREAAINKRRQSPVLESILSLMFPPHPPFPKHERLSVERYHTIENTKGHDANKQQYAAIPCLTLDVAENVCVGVKGKVLPIINCKRGLPNNKLKGVKSPMKEKIGYLLDKLTIPKEGTADSIKLTKLLSRKKHSKSEVFKKVAKNGKCDQYVETDGVKLEKKVEEWLPSPWENFYVHQNNESQNSSEV